MRTELENIALIESYIAGELSTEETATVEAKLASSPSFQSQLIAQKKLQSAVTKAALRKEMRAAGKAVAFKTKLKKWVIGGATAIAIGSAAYFAVTLTDNKGSSISNEKGISVTEVLAASPKKENNMANYSHEVLDIEEINTLKELDKVDQMITSSEPVFEEDNSFKEIDGSGKKKTLTASKGNVVSRAEAGPLKIAESEENIKEVQLDKEIVKPAPQLYLISSPDATTETKDTIDPYKFKLADFSSKKQIFFFNPKKDTLIIVKKNLEVFIPANSFYSKRKQNLRIEIESYLTISEMLLKGLTTTTKKGDLETNGMINMHVFQNKKEVSLAPNRGIVIGFPGVEKGSNYLLFDGNYEQTSSSLESSSTVMPESTLKNSLDSITTKKENANLVLWSEQNSGGIIEGDFIARFIVAHSLKFPKYMYTSIGEDDRKRLIEDEKQLKGEIKELRDVAYWTKKTGVSPYPVVKDGAVISGDLKFLFKMYEEILNKNILPSGYISFLLDKAGKPSALEYDGKMSANDINPLLDSITAITRWRAGNTGGHITKKLSPVQVPKKRVCIFDLSWKKYIYHPILGPKIKYLSKKQDMGRPQNRVSLYKSLKLKWINCDRYVTFTQNQGDFKVSGHHARAKTFLLFKKYRTIRGYNEKADNNDLLFNGISKKTPLMLVSLKENEEGVFAATKEFDEFNGTISIGEYQRLTKQEFKDLLHKLNNIHKDYRRKRVRNNSASTK
jgi:hypothetical protein